MARRRNRYIDYLQYLLVRLCAMFAFMFDVRVTYRTARWVGELIWRFDRRHREIACRQLRLSFPNWSDDRVRRVARRSIHNMLYLAVEIIFTPRLVKPNTWRRHIRLRNTAENVRLMVRRDTGLIMLSGHFGNWEVVSYLMATLDFPTVSVARPLANPYLNEFILGVRERTGQSMLYKKGATAGMSEVLSGRGILAFMADQDAGRKGLYVDFFGRPASTYRSIALMAIRHKVPVVVGYSKRLGGGYRFEAGVARIIHPREWADKEDEPTWITQEFTRELEKVVRQSPEQYLWLHRRWKHRPDGTKAPGGVA